MSDIEQENNTPALDPQIEQEARGQGWVPLEEFRDDESKWVDADTFVKRGREINPILRKNNESLRKELDKAKKDAKEAIEAAKEFREYQKERFDEKVRSYEAQIEELKRAKKDAISQGDGDRAVAIDDTIDALREEKQSLKKPEAPRQAEEAQELAPELEAWIERNSWYGKDNEDSYEATEIANGIAAAIRKANPTLVGQAFLDKLDARLADRNIGSTKKREVSSSQVEGGSSGTNRPRSTKKGYEQLPGEAKAACDRFVRAGLLTKEEYLASYEWD